LGGWLRSFHEWAALPERAELRAIVEGNHEMQSIKCRLNYDGIIRMVDRSPHILESAKGVFGQVREMAVNELKDPTALSVIHGDFWTGK
jgi:hypothetical protein